jgi:RNA polymerase sigma-70 factor, ECF subfamily
MIANSYLDKTDEQIASLVQKGETNAFSFLIEKYQEKIKRYIKRFVQGEEIEDICQNVFLKAFSNIQSFNTKLKFSTWLYRIAHNEMVNSLKKKRTLPLFDFDVFFPHLQGGRKDIETETEKKMLLSVFEKCFENLEPKYKEVIILYYLENLPYHEIADILHSPISTVGIRIKRAKEILKKICATNHQIYGTKN